MSIIVPEEDELIRDPDILRRTQHTYADGDLEQEQMQADAQRDLQAQNGGGRSGILQAIAASQNGDQPADENEFDRAQAYSESPNKPSGLPPEYAATMGRVKQVLNEQPVRQKPSILQSIAAAGIGGLGGYVNAGRKTYIDPSAIQRAEDAATGTAGFNQATADWKQRLRAAQEQAQLQEDQRLAEQGQQSFETGQAQKQAQTDEAKARTAETVADTGYKRQATANKTADNATANARKQFEDATKIISLGGKRMRASDPVPEGYSSVPDPTDPTSMYAIPEAKTHFVANPAFVKAADEAGVAGLTSGQTYSMDVWKTVVGAITKANTEPKTSDKTKAIAIYGKPKQSWTPDEQAFIKGYEKENDVTKTQPGIMRIEALAATRGVPVIDTKNGNRLSEVSMDEINRANREEPGRYSPASQGVGALGKDAIFRSMYYTVAQARRAVQALPELDAATRAALADQLKSTDPKSAISTFLRGEIGTHLNPQQQEAVQSLASLAEDAMTLRSVSGMGQGSDDLRSAILATIPSGKTPSKEYAMGQLDKFEQLARRIHSGVPTVGNQGGPPAQGNQGPAANGMINVQIPGHPPGQIPASAEAQFRRDHPDARVF